MQAKNLILFLLCVALLCSPSFLFAGTTGKIVGKVVDAQTNETLPGVNVIVEGTTFGAATDLEGEFLILRLPPGTYAVRASMIGYTALRYDHVTVSIDKTTELNFSLGETVLELGETVTIVATKPIVERDLTSTSATISAEVIQRLPVETFQDVVNLQAGVVEGHFRGGRSGEVAYLIDGISINDVYSGDFSVQVENNSIAELQVISGTFNAEYGQAMSGIVNVVTKEGGNKYHGRLSAYLGDYVSNNKDIFWNIDAFNPIYNGEGSLSGPVPLLGNKLTFFVSGRYNESEGAIYGRRVFTPQDSSSFPSDYGGAWYIESNSKGYRFYSEEQYYHVADSIKSAAEFVPMKPEKRWTGQLKLTYKINASNKIDYEGLFQHKKYKEYGDREHEFRFNPDGSFWRYQLGWNNSMTFTRVINDRTFFTLKGARFFTDYKQYVYDDPYDERYVNPQLLETRGSNSFRTGGQEMWHFKRNTTTNIGKMDLTAQVTNEHQFKLGVEGRYHRLWLRSFEIRLNRETNWETYVPSTTKNVQNNDEYLFHPLEFSGYLQDKIELDYMVVNAGVRFDYFDSDGNVPLDFLQPSKSDLEESKPDMQLSPRFGLSYPITDRGAIHVSYGHFFQIPNFEYLYSNPEFELYYTNDYGTTDPPVGEPNTIGNADIKPQKTVIYEIGLQQQLSTDLSLDVTGYFKDIRNLLGTEILYSIEGIRYARYINRDYGNVKGLTFALEKRVSNGFGATVDYTYQIAKGNASDPASAFLDVRAGREPQKQLVPLDWDRTHSLNMTVTVGDPDLYSLSLIGRLGSGLPYTPTEQNVRTAVENSERRPAFYTFDFYAYRNMTVNNFNFSLFLRVFNLFDRKNETDVYSDTGRANYSLAALNAGTIFGLNTLDEFITRPHYYSDPRTVIVGLAVDF